MTPAVSGKFLKSLAGFKWKGFKRNSLTAGRINLHILFIDSWFHPPIHPKGVSEHLLCTSHVSDARDTVKDKCNIPTFIYFPLIEATEEWTNSCITWRLWPEVRTGRWVRNSQVKCITINMGESVMEGSWGAWGMVPKDCPVANKELEYSGD